ncbi:MAG TPA: T9SS type A sorting domain-containing protein [Bacteroidia bacterium]|nr:T9SS type A sorting domain-containing protein [Bacteroidia bacterium]
MKIFVSLFFVLSGLIARAQPLNFTVTNSVPIYSITCAVTSLSLLAHSNFSAPVNYSWSGPGVSSTGPSLTVSSPGNYQVTGSSGIYNTTQTISIGVDTVVPISSASSTFQQVPATVTPVQFTFTAVSPTINIVHNIYGPFGNWLANAGGLQIVFFPGSDGTYLHCITNLINGCKSCQPFILQFGPIVPTGTVGINENTLEKASVFPNPNNGLFKIETKDNQVNHLEIYDNLGRLVRTESLAGSAITVDFQKEKSGIYMIKCVEMNGRVSFIKMIKE